MAIQDPGRFLPRIDWQTRAAFQKLASALEKQGLDLRVRSGLRSCSEQNTLYAQGRTTPGPIVTEAPGCRSWHVTGRAVDADPIDRRTGQMASIASGAYAVAGAIWEQMGGGWGGRFDFGDYGHFDWHPGIRISDVCPNANACDLSVTQIASVAPPFAGVSPWLAAVGGFAVVGAFLWFQRS